LIGAREDLCEFLYCSCFYEENILINILINDDHAYTIICSFKLNNKYIIPKVTYNESEQSLTMTINTYEDYTISYYNVTLNNVEQNEIEHRLKEEIKKYAKLYSK